MELPVLDKFCFIFHLKTGCITMGIMNSILTFVLAVILITFAVDIKAASESVKRDEVDTVSSVVYTIVVLLVILLFIKFVLDMVFVYAVYKGFKFVIVAMLKHDYIVNCLEQEASHNYDRTSLKEKCGLMKKYCIFWVVFLVLFIIGFLKSLFHMDAGHVIAQILFLAENFYYIVVIRSYLISIHEDGVL